MPSVGYGCSMVKQFIYVLADSRRPSTAAYVGKTTDPARRYVTHRSGAEPITKNWVKDTLRLRGELRMWILEMVPESTASVREMEWITTLQPFLNRNGKKFEFLPSVPRDVLKT